MTDYLVDTSAWFVARREQATMSRFTALMYADRLAIAAPITMEILRSARNGREFSEMRTELAYLPQVDVTLDVWDAAFDIYESFAKLGGSHHRPLPMPDLLIAGAGIASGRTLLHYDQHFDRIAEVTGQPTEWIAPRGSL